MADERDARDGTGGGGLGPASYLPLGIGIGLAIGAGLGLTVLDNLAMGMGIGLAIGAAIGAGGYATAYASGTPTDGSTDDDAVAPDGEGLGPDIPHGPDGTGDASGTDSPDAMGPRS